MVFKKGESGNPKGRPKGALNKATIMAQQICDNAAEQIAAKAVEMALAGDATALRLVLERLVPAKKGAQDINLAGQEGGEPIAVDNALTVKFVGGENDR